MHTQVTRGRWLGCSCSLVCSFLRHVEMQALIHTGKRFLFHTRTAGKKTRGPARRTRRKGRRASASRPELDALENAQLEVWRILCIGQTKTPGCPFQDAAAWLPVGPNFESSPRCYMCGQVHRALGRGKGPAGRRPGEPLNGCPPWSPAAAPGTRSSLFQTSTPLCPYDPPPKGFYFLCQ